MVHLKEETDNNCCNNRCKVRNEFLNVNFIQIFNDLMSWQNAKEISLFFRLSYVFVIGKGNKPWISLPKGKGVKLSIAEERDRRLAAKTS